MQGDKNIAMTNAPTTAPLLFVSICFSPNENDDECNVV